MRHGIGGKACLADEIQQQNAHFIAGKEPVLPFWAACGDAAAVAVRVSADEKIGMRFFAELQTLLHSLPDLRVRIRAGLEIPVRLCLAWNNGDISGAEPVQQSLYAFQSAAAERRIDEPQTGAVGVCYTLGVNGVDIRVQNAVRDRLDASICAGFLIAAGFYIRKAVDSGDFCPNGICCVQRDLTAVRAVYLIAVILCGIVACRDADACAA